MKKSTAIRLTVAGTLVLGGASAACSRQEEGPEMTFRGYCDPNQPEVCHNEPRMGFVPMFIPMYFGGRYYDERGVARTRPGGPMVRNAPAPTARRGGFGTIGAGRSTGA